MSNNGTITLTRDKILQLLAAVGQNKPKDEPDIEAADYNWKEPHFFNKEQLEKLGEFAKSAAKSAAARFTHFFQAEFKAEATEINQHYAGYFVNRTVEQDHKSYYLILKNSQNVPCGLIIAPTSSANKWLTLLLGDSGNRDDSANQLSRLETSLLTDITKSLAEAILTFGDKINLRPDGNISSNHFSLEVGDSEELLEINFDISKNESQDKTQAQLLLPCKMLLTIAGKTDTAKTVAPKDTQNAILEHLKEIPIVINAQLASTEITIEQIFTLQAQDILLLDKKITEPISLTIDGNDRFLGRLAKSKGKYAAVITAACPIQSQNKDT